MIESINKIIIVASSWLFILLYLHSDIAWKGAVQSVAKKGNKQLHYFITFCFVKRQE